MAALDLVFAITPLGTHYEVLLPDCTTAEEEAVCVRVLCAAGLPDTVWRNRLMTTPGAWWVVPRLVGRFAVTAWGPEAMQRLAAYEAWHETACDFLT